MPRKPEDTVVKDVLYPDDLPGEGLVVREMAYWDTEDPEDAAELPDGAKRGLWLPVSFVGNGEAETWAASPRGLREALLDLGVEAGDAFRVTECEKGPQPHDPYDVTVEYPYQP